MIHVSTKLSRLILVAWVGVLISPSISQALSMQTIVGSSSKVRANQVQGNQVQSNQLRAKQVQATEVDEVEVFVEQETETSPSQSFHFLHDAQFQTFRIDRIAPQTDSPQMRVQQFEGMRIQVRPTIRRGVPLDPVQWEGVQIQSKSNIARASQIVLEMKKGKGKTKEVAIGMFAPSSWIKSNDGVVQLYTESHAMPRSAGNRYWIGVRCREKSSSPYLEVEEVVAESSADKAGIQVKDRLVSWNETALSDISTLVATIQKNQDRTAQVQIRRGGAEIELEVTPAMKPEPTQVRTIIAPATRMELAEQRIDEMQQLIKLEGDDSGQQVRLLLVGPAVNFGKEEIALQIKSDVQRQKESLKELLENVAKKKLGMIVDGDSFTLKKAPDLSALNAINFEPHEIWETMEIGTDGKMISFATLAPRMIKQSRVEFKFEPDQVEADHLPHTIHELETGQIVFPNPLGTLELDVRMRVDRLMDENKRFRSENEKLKEQIIKLRGQLKQQK